MRDAKRVRLLAPLSEKIDQSISILVKLVWDHEPRKMWIRDSEYDFDYYASSVKAIIGGFPRGWYDF